jgi:hypothetical protein
MVNRWWCPVASFCSIDDTQLLRSGCLFLTSSRENCVQNVTPESTTFMMWSKWACFHSWLFHVDYVHVVSLPQVFTPGVVAAWSRVTVAVVGHLSIKVVCLFCFVMSRKISATALLVPLESPQWVRAPSLGDKKTRQCKSYKRILLEKEAQSCHISEENIVEITIFRR